MGKDKFDFESIFKNDTPEKIKEKNKLANEETVVLEPDDSDEILLPDEDESISIEPDETPTVVEPVKDVGETSDEDTVSEPVVEKVKAKEFDFDAIFTGEDEETPKTVPVKVEKKPVVIVEPVNEVMEDSVEETVDIDFSDVIENTETDVVEPVKEQTPVIENIVVEPVKEVIEEPVVKIARVVPEETIDIDEEVPFELTDEYPGKDSDSVADEIDFSDVMDMNAKPVEKEVKKEVVEPVNEIVADVEEESNVSLPDISISKSDMEAPVEQKKSQLSESIRTDKGVASKKEDKKVESVPLKNVSVNEDSKVTDGKKKFDMDELKKNPMFKAVIAGVVMLVVGFFIGSSQVKTPEVVKVNGTGSTKVETKIVEKEVVKTVELRKTYLAVPEVSMIGVKNANTQAPVMDFGKLKSLLSQASNASDTDELVIYSLMGRNVDIKTTLGDIKKGLILVKTESVESKDTPAPTPVVSNSGATTNTGSNVESTGAQSNTDKVETIADMMK